MLLNFLTSLPKYGVMINRAQTLTITKVSPPTATLAAQSLHHSVYHEDFTPSHIPFSTSVAVLGEPDVYPKHGADWRASCFSTSNGGEEFLEVTFAQEMYITEVHVYETYWYDLIDQHRQTHTPRHPQCSSP